MTVLFLRCFFKKRLPSVQHASSSFRKRGSQKHLTAKYRLTNLVFQVTVPHYNLSRKTMLHRQQLTVQRRPPIQRKASTCRNLTVFVSNDASAKVRGDYRRVFLYVANLESWSAWYPGKFLGQWPGIDLIKCVNTGSRSWDE